MVGAMKSMTGFGRGEARAGEINCAVELSSVNRKQLDLDIRLPREWATLEPEVRRILQSAVTRGRLNVVVSVETISGGDGTTLQVNEELARRYVEELERLARALGRALPLNAESLLRAPGVFSLAEGTALPPETVWPAMEAALREALTAWNDARAREGLHLSQDLRSRLQTVRGLLAQIRDLAPQVPVLHRDALRKRLEEAGLPLPLDDERLLREIALFADRCDISEEIARLAGHLDEFLRLLDGGAPSGRAMDFLTQEMHRELNTMGAKANHAGIAHLVVAGKTEVERIREQVQNVE